MKIIKNQLRFISREMEGIRLGNSQGELIPSVRWPPLEENKAWRFPDPWETCIFWTRDEHMWNSNGPLPFSRVPHLCNLISFSHRPTVLLQCEALSSQLCAEFHLFWLLPICPNSWTFFVWMCLSFLFGLYVGVKLLGPMVCPFE